MKKLILAVPILMVAMLIASCDCDPKATVEAGARITEIENKVNEFATFKLTTDLSKLTENEKQMLPLLVEAAQLMDELFWYEAYGDKQALCGNEALSKAEHDFMKINYGPWERLNANTPFIEGVGPKPAGANFYPADMTKAEFDALEDETKNSLYTFIRRDENNALKVVPYYIQFNEQVVKLSELLKKAAVLADDAGLKNYLELRAEAVLTDDYQASDMAWMDMKTNTIDMVVGPIENYEDALFGTKAAHEAYILVKDQEWSERLAKFAALLPALQQKLPVADEYKQDKPGSDSDLNAYDVVYYAGDCNAGSKTIAINLPNDEEVQQAKGSRRLQLKNAMQAKFDKILSPISELIIAQDQRKHVTFDAFFANTMFHEAAHGIGVKNTINGKGTAREALGNTYSAIEEGKADILGLWIVTELASTGDMGEIDLMDNYVTFMAGIFRSVRFGVASSHGKANMIRFYYFQEAGAFTRDATTGTYRIDFDKMQEAMNALAHDILVMQGDGNRVAAQKVLDEMGSIRKELQTDLDRISEAGIPRDIVFEQGLKAMGLE